MTQGSVVTELLPKELGTDVEWLSPPATGETEAVNNADPQSTQSAHLPVDLEVEPEQSLPQEADEITVQEGDVAVLKFETVQLQVRCFFTVPRHSLTSCIGEQRCTHKPDCYFGGVPGGLLFCSRRGAPAYINYQENAKEVEIVPQADLLVITDSELESPKSPWTPSYSVMTQGSVATEPLSDGKIEDAGGLSLPATDESEMAQTESQPVQTDVRDILVDNKITELEKVPLPQETDDQVTTEEVDAVVPFSEVAKLQVRSFVTIPRHQLTLMKDSDDIGIADAVHIDTSMVHSGVCFFCGRLKAPSHAIY
jgi:hypothetical protein